MVDVTNLDMWDDITNAITSSIHAATKALYACAVVLYGVILTLPKHHT